MIIIGHRGAAGHEPENTLGSFAKGLELGVDMVELDVHLSSDGRLMVIHDPILDRTTDGKGPVSRKTAEEIRSFDAGKGQKIPFLEEVIDLVDRRVPINIELKSAGSAAAVAGIIGSYLKKGWGTDDFYISSFDHNELVVFSREIPGVRIGAIIVGVPVNFAQYAADFGSYSINLPFEMADSRLIDDAKKKGIKVYIWNISEPENFAEIAVKLGADGCITNFPDRAKGL